MIGGGGDSKFESFVNKTPFSWEKVLGWGMGWFISEQDPEKVEFEAVKNGYVIKVETDEENTRDAANFWKNYVQPRLTGDD